MVGYMLGCSLSKAVAGVVGFREACSSNSLFQDIDNALAGKCCRLEPEEGGIWWAWVLYK